MQQTILWARNVVRRAFLADGSLRIPTRGDGLPVAPLCCRYHAMRHERVQRSTRAWLLAARCEQNLAWQGRRRRAEKTNRRLAATRRSSSWRPLSGAWVERRVGRGPGS